jgi:glycerol uptake facilitator protein
MARKFWAELLGTWVLVLIGCGSVVSANVLIGGGAGKLDLGALFAIGLCFGIAVVAMIYTVGHISGCHINPAVTVALAVTGKMPWKEVPAYVIAQFIGAVGGALTLALIFGTGGVEASALGAPAVGANPAWGVYAAEFVGTLVLVFTIFGVAVDGRAPAGWAGLAIGLVVAGLITALGTMGGQSINPARGFGPYLIDAFYGKAVNWTDYLLGYALAPLLGGALGGLIYENLVAGKAAKVDKKAASAD